MSPEAIFQKRPDETWKEFWDRRADEIHGAGCKCLYHQIRARDLAEEVKPKEEYL